jgi:predicted metal-dependent hydrolase
MIIELDGIPVTIIRKSIKNMYLRVKPVTGDVVVSAPNKLSLQIIKAQLLAKQAWIHTARARAHIHKRTLQTSPSMESGEQHFFLGTPYTLMIHPNTSSRKIIIEGEFLHGFLQSYSYEKRVNMLQAWYKEQMQNRLPDLIQKWEPIIGVRVHAWGIKTMKTRWGSCNVRAHRIWINLRLIQKPLICLEYVLVHEMVHLLEASHNKRFYALMTQFMPDWKSHQKQLESVYP